MLKLSIIIPVYNVERFVERCIRSVAEQDLNPNEYEVIVINDGSTDNSLIIVNNVIKQYENIVLINQENRGLGAARNVGIERARGAYIWFVDSDDFIHKDVLSQLTSKALTSNLDVLSFDFNCTDEIGNEIEWINFKLNFEEKKEMTGPEFYNLNYADSYIWLYLFKTSLFKDNRIYFKERINMQDSELLPRLLVHVTKISFLDRQVISYVNRSDSFINNAKAEVRLKYYNSIIQVGKLLNEFKETTDSESLMNLGLEKKMDSINKILFQQFIYNSFENNTLKSLLTSLKQERFFPFKPIREANTSRNVVYNLLRIFVNIAPLTSRNIYLALKK